MSYKTASFKAPDQSDRYRAQARQLQELFPSWSNEDLQSLLNEVGGDVELAATRISEGHAEQWGSVTRKKDKKPSAAPSKEHSSRERGPNDFRGGRGGRGGARGGPGRGGASARTRGAPGGRGGAHTTTNGRHTPSGSVNGSAWAEPAPSATPVNDATPEASPKPTENKVRPSEPEAIVAEATIAPSSSARVASGWGVPTTLSTTSNWGGDTDANGSAASSVKPSPLPSKASKLPATSKMSWAQIARPQEKPTPSPVPAQPLPVPSAHPLTPPLDTKPPPASEPEPTFDVPQPQQTEWEDPATVQEPVWDEEEPQVQPSVSVVDAWQPEPPVENAAPPEPEAPISAPEPEPVPDPIPSALPAQLQSQIEGLEKSITPEPPKTRPAPVSHKSSARYKTIDQPVVMPSSNYSAGLERVGMQFGSLSLNGDSLVDNNNNNTEDHPIPEPVVIRTAPEPEAPKPSPPAPVQAPEPPQPQPSQSHAPASVSPSVSVGSTLFQQPPPQPTPQQQQQPTQQTPQHTLPSSLSQSIQPAQPTATASPIQPFSHHQQQQPPLSQQTQQQSQSLVNHHHQQSQAHAQHHQYSQHGLPTHVEPTQTQTPQHAPQPQQQTSLSYFRQTETPYFHAPTPPAPQGQESPYGVSFGQQLGGQQVQHQNQASHLSGFGGDYGYNDGQRGFYESYSQQTGFGSRNALGHDDVKGLPSSAQQQAPVNAGLAPSNTQASQQQGAGQPQQAGGQGGPQQGYPPPIPPYYYAYPQSQYYGSPYNSGYGLPQPFVKYPTMFQPGPPGPGSAPSPAAKQGPPTSVQPPSNPYGQSLYGQQHPSSGYDDLSYGHHTPQHQHQHSQGVGAAGDYGKQLYGAQGMQGFMGLGQGNGPSSGPQRAAGGSPETSYKQYAPVKDVGAGVAQGRAGVQQPQQGGFYGSNRFTSNAAAGGPQGQQQSQPQGQGPQGHLGYPQQGQSDGGFYSYQPRQQQGYWQ